MSSMQGMRKASVLPLPVFAAARTSLQRHKVVNPSNNESAPPPPKHFPWKARSDTNLPSSRGRMLLCWISVMCSKPISFTPFSVFSLTSAVRESKDVSSKAPEMSRKGGVSVGNDQAGVKLCVLVVGPVGRNSVVLSQRPPQVSLYAFADTRCMMESTGRATHKGNMEMHFCNHFNSTSLSQSKIFNKDQ